MLSEKTCIPCQGGIPKLTEEKIKSFLNQVKKWEAVDSHHIKKDFKFPDFVSALDFVNKVGKVAESENHHPNIYLTWGSVTIMIYTHKIDGLHENDFILASKIDNINN